MLFSLYMGAAILINFASIRTEHFVALKSSSSFIKTLVDQLTMPAGKTKWRKQIFLNIWKHY